MTSDGSGPTWADTWDVEKDREKKVATCGGNENSEMGVRSDTDGRNEDRRNWTREPYDSVRNIHERFVSRI